MRVGPCTERRVRGGEPSRREAVLQVQVWSKHSGTNATEFDTKSHRVHYPAITRAELFAGNTATELVKTLLAPFREFPVGRPLAERAGRVRRKQTFACQMPLSGTPMRCQSS